MSFTITSKQQDMLNWFTAQLKALDPSQEIHVAYSEGVVQGPVAPWPVVHVTWIRGAGADTWTSDLDGLTATFGNNEYNQLNAGLVDAKEKFMHVTAGVPLVRYPDPDAPPSLPPPPPPVDLVIPGPTEVIDGRNWRTDTRLSDGKKRRVEQMPFGSWAVVEDWH